AIARVWRAGCIIRSAMLNDMASALERDAGTNLIFADYFSALLKQHHVALRNLVATAMLHGHAVPALAAGLAWFDQIRTARSTANMIQAQRDFFGAHSFERIDADGAHHGPWGLHDGS
ncbi:MAG: NADP-dependent phosphogluconate dehydrogenase, partial [Nitratireductor sp.]|nr:NADP-dependent phosphogluconate dehydrogenase [Nitratireductor sp.]